CCGLSGTVGSGAAMTDESRLIGLPRRADWRRLSLPDHASNGSTVVITLGKRYRHETAGDVMVCDNSLLGAEHPGRGPFRHSRAGCAGLLRISYLWACTSSRCRS